METNHTIHNRPVISANQYYLPVLAILTSCGIAVSLAIPAILKRFQFGGMTVFWFLTTVFFVTYAYLGVCFYMRGLYDKRLLRAAREGKFDEVKLLLDHGAHVNRKDERGFTALTHAAAIGSADIAKVLIDHGADVYEIDNDDMTVLMHALANDHFKVADLLRQAGADK